MKTALIIGYGQIGKEIASQLSRAGIHTKIATRSGRPSPAAQEVPSAPQAITISTEFGGVRTETPATAMDHVQVDAANRAQLLQAAENVDAIFACAHAPYDSRQWVQILPQLDSTIMDVAETLDIPVVFPESVYAYAGLGTPITESSPFAPAEAKGRIRQDLIAAREAHGARTASVVAGDLIGGTAEPGSSVVRICISDPIRHGRRSIVPAKLDVPHGLTVIADLASAMTRAAESLDGVPTSTHRLLIAPSSNPTMREIISFTYRQLGTAQRKPVSVPRWATRVAGVVDRSMYELSELAPIWYEPCVIVPGEFAEAVGRTQWEAGVAAMLD